MSGKFTRSPLLWILLFGIAIRLIGVASPILGWHAWRQADTSSMARNFYSGGYDFLNPQIDWGGNTPGIVECEFPIYPYILAMLYPFTGVHAAVGRLVSALFASLTIVYLFLLGRALFGHRTGLWAAALFALLPIVAFYGRVVMPEPLMLCASVAGIYHFVVWVGSSRIRDLSLSCLFVTLAALVKLPALYLGLPLLYLAWGKYGRGFIRRPELWSFAGVTLSIVAAWYAHAHALKDVNGLTFGIWEYGSDKWGNWDLVFSVRYWNTVLFSHLAERIITWPIMGLFLIGLFHDRRSRTGAVVDVWLVALLVYLIVVAKGNYIHEYYQLPLVPPVVLIVARLLGIWVPGSFTNNKRSILLALVLIGAFSLGTIRFVQYHRGEDAQRSHLYQLAQAIQEHTPPRSPILLLDGSDPTLLYLAGRKGWHVTIDQLTNPDLTRYRDLGARALVIVQRHITSEPDRARYHELTNGFPTLYTSTAGLVLGLE